jgi:hypothetical protein
MDYMNWMQWPAMVLTTIAAWLVGSRSPVKRNVGFWIFLVSNILWVIWGWHARAYALIVLQLCLAALNLRGAQKTEMADNSRADPGIRKQSL